KVDRPREALRLPDLYATLHAAVWSELRTGRQIPLLRRNLQREYVTQVANALIRPAQSMPADARALLRADAKRLHAELAAAQSRRWSREAQAHIADMLAMLDEAQKAPIVRQGL
ncbi:MAG: metallopeptidase, partial [Betaproteobacteria bacterium]|nr:metallopeptidase [Betaproteobacteria bacterium]